jgi:hypothetical protein
MQLAFHKSVLDTHDWSSQKSLVKFPFEDYIDVPSIKETNATPSYASSKQVGLYRYMLTNLPDSIQYPIVLSPLLLFPPHLLQLLNLRTNDVDAPRQGVSMVCCGYVLDVVLPRKLFQADDRYHPVFDDMGGEENARDSAISIWKWVDA